MRKLKCPQCLFVFMVAVVFLPEYLPINVFLSFKGHLPGYLLKSDCLLFDIFYSILVLLVTVLILSLTVSSCTKAPPLWRPRSQCLVRIVLPHLIIIMTQIYGLKYDMQIGGQQITLLDHDVLYFGKRSALLVLWRAIYR